VKNMITNHQQWKMMGLWEKDDATKNNNNDSADPRMYSKI
jgi:hypothetical protein